MAVSKRHPDYILLSIIALLILWGILTLGTTSFPLSTQRYGTPWHYFFHQLLILGIGLALGFVAFKIPLEKLKKWAFAFFLFNLFLLLLVFLPKIGLEAGGSQRWLSFGSFVVQPSEFLKVTFILYLAAWLASHLSDKKENKKKKKDLKFLFVPFSIIIIALLVCLILQPDMSTLGIICAAAIFMYFSIPAPWWHVPIFLASAAGGGALLAKISPYRMARVLVFLNPQIDPMGIGYQFQQSLIAIGSGRILGIEGGLALGMSQQKFGLLPQAMTDSIFAIIGEELGLIGCAALIALFLFFAWRGLKVFQKSKDDFSRLVAMGITVWITLQAFFNIGGAVGVLPLAGIPLPFFSYGGSHLIAEMIGMGILLNISKR